MARLTIKEGPNRGAVYELTRKTVVIGRSDKSDLQLADPTVSRLHATIRSDAADRCTIRDNGSSYGICVNDRKVAEAVLADGDLLQIGNCILRFNQLTAAEEDEASTATIIHVLDAVPSTHTGTGAGATVATSVAERHLRAAYEISGTISASFDVAELCQKVLGAIFGSIQADRAALFLLDEATGKVRAQAAMDAMGREDDVRFSYTIIRQVMSKGESLLFEDVQGVGDLASADSIIVNNIRSAMCVPLRWREKIVGTINVDAFRQNVFSFDDLQLLTIIGNQVGMMIHIARLAEENVKAARLAAVGQTVASLAHCIKNILQGLKGASYMVDEGLKTAASDLVTAGWPLVKNSQQRISELVLNMLDYSKERTPAYQRTCLRGHLENIHNLMKERAAEQCVTIEFAYGEAMPDVDCDPLAIYRAVLNLVTNAIDAAEQGGGLVTIAAQPGDDGKSVTIAVADNGPGISPEAKDKLFQAFHSTKASKGTGLGLAVTKKIVDEHRGAIDIKTEAGKGTTFAISLPVARPEICGCDP